MNHERLSELEREPERTKVRQSHRQSEPEIERERARVSQSEPERVPCSKLIMYNNEKLAHKAQQ